MIKEVRNWLHNQTDRELVGGTRIVHEFETFASQIPQMLAAMHKSEQDLENYLDYHNLVYKWIKANVIEE